MTSDMCVALRIKSACMGSLCNKATISSICRTFSKKASHIATFFCGEFPRMDGGGGPLLVVPMGRVSAYMIGFKLYMI